VSTESGVERTEETIFTWGAPPLKFGAGAVDEVGFELTQYGAKRVLIITDPTIRAEVERVVQSLILCVNQGELLRSFSLFDDEYLRRIIRPPV